MDDIELLHRLLYRALIEIRDASRDANDKVSYHLADLFHVAAMEMGDAANGNRSYSDVLESLHKRAEAKGCGRWLAERSEQLQGRATGQNGSAPGSKLAG